ncbi:MAG: SMP-30/gluconolactonase/LRE family protein [Sphingomonas sp.]
MTEFRIVAREGRDGLGEGPLWSPSRGGLFWVDIVAPALRFLHLASGRIDSWTMPERIGWVVERRGTDGLIAGLKSGFHDLDLDPFLLRLIGDPEPDRPENRLNDAKVDAAGRIWAGSKDDRDLAASGALYRLDSDRSWSRNDDGYGVTNGPTFSLDGTILYHTDSPTRTVYAFDLAPDGSLSGKRPFIRFDEDWGYPDGMTTDAEGGLWIAHWDGGRISRFWPDGSLDRSVALPAANITSIAFAGAALDRMFVTSASLDDDRHEHAGALFEVFAGATGLLAGQYAG